MSDANESDDVDPAATDVIAIDGPAGSGKSTIAKALARRLGVAHLDTGAMYRGATFLVLEEGVDLGDEHAIVALTGSRTMDFGDRVMVDGVDATEAIRGSAVSDAVSVVAAVPGVRAILRERQREWARLHGGGVVEGRDIGTVVFPDARLKVYLTASPEVRARRRAGEQGVADEAAIAEWAANIAERDHRDSTRADSPLSEADGAWVLDTSDLGVDEVVQRIVDQLGGEEPAGEEVGP